MPCRIVSRAYVGLSLVLADPILAWVSMWMLSCNVCIGWRVGWLHLRRAAFAEEEQKEDCWKTSLLKELICFKVTFPSLPPELKSLQGKWSKPSPVSEEHMRKLRQPTWDETCGWYQRFATLSTYLLAPYDCHMLKTLDGSGLLQHSQAAKHPKYSTTYIQKRFNKTETLKGWHCTFDLTIYLEMT